MAVALAPTAEELLCDVRGRPYFLWDCDVTLARLMELLRADDVEERAYWVGKTMRQAKPDDALRFVSRDEMRRLWPHLERYLGRSRDFWRWVLGV